jgi:flagellar biosynthesis/type III secretory pathway M-ring protein FliF/YscJ
VIDALSARPCFIGAFPWWRFFSLPPFIPKIISSWVLLLPILLVIAYIIVLVFGWYAITKTRGKEWEEEERKEYEQEAEDQMKAIDEWEKKQQEKKDKKKKKK